MCVPFIPAITRWFKDTKNIYFTYAVYADLHWNQKTRTSPFIAPYIAMICSFLIYRTNTNTQNCFSSRLLVFLCPIHWSQVLSQEWKCSWSSADKRCSDYIWVNNLFIAYQGATYIRGLTVELLMADVQFLSILCYFLSLLLSLLLSSSPSFSFLIIITMVIIIITIIIFVILVIIIAITICVRIMIQVLYIIW